MLILSGKSHWIGCVLAAIVTVGYAGQDTPGRQLNPYHEKQLQAQIQKCASGILACTDAEMRCVKQQELCQLLIRSERYDEALQVAHNVFKTPEANDERRAAHHFLVAEIYNMKMQASGNVSEMEKNRQSALSAAQEVVNKQYPSKWGISDHARRLIKDLSDTNYMGRVRQRVASRQGQTGDSAKEAIADAQRRYLDATQGGGAIAPSTAANSPKFTRVPSKQRTESQAVEVSDNKPAVGSTSTAVPSSPSVKRTFSTERYQTGETMHVGRRLQSTGLLTSQASGVQNGAGEAGTNGAQVNSAVDSVAEKNLATLLEAARKRKEAERKSSPYAIGQQPTGTIKQ